MSAKSLGGSTGYVSITASGTPERITKNQTVPSARFTCHTIFVQQHAANTGKLYFMGGATGSGASGVNVLWTIPAPTLSSGVAVILPWMAFTIPYAPGGLNAADYYLDVDNSGDKATVSVIVA